MKLLKQNKYIEDTEVQKEENKYIIVCLISMFIVPVMMGCYMVVIDKIPKEVSDIMLALYYGVLFGAFIMFLTLFSCTIKYRPNKWWSIKRFNKLFDSLQKDVKTEYFMRVKYVLKKDEEGYVIIINEEEIGFDDDKEFPKEYIKKVSMVFGDKEISYFFEDYEER